MMRRVAVTGATRALRCRDWHEVRVDACLVRMLNEPFMQRKGEDDAARDTHVGTQHESMRKRASS
jgi:UDP:flavonoid glycosyltransferase YjiC (YdhE family)